MEGGVTDPASPEPDGSSTRNAVRDGVLALLLVLASSLVGIPLLALIAFGVPGLGASRVEVLAIPSFLVGGALAAWMFRGWPGGRVHARVWLTTAAALGALGAYFVGMVLDPSPDLLGDDVLGRGPIAFLLQAAETLLPWLFGALLAFVALRWDSGRATGAK
jgi:hypothetical protein